MLLGDDHGGEAPTGPPATPPLPISCYYPLVGVWVLGEVFADRNAPAIGRILDQQGVGGSTLTHGFIKSTPLEGQAAPPPW